jgi:hypothetical protein
MNKRQHGFLGAIDMELFEHFLSNQGEPIHKNLHYFSIYERHLRQYVGLPVTMIEIGTGGGGSAQMWRRYLGPLARIVSLDIRPECRQFETEQVSVRIGDQSSELFLQSVLDEFGTPDIVLDDGSHQMDHVTATFAFLYSRISSRGTYMVEDLHTAYWSEFGGGLGRPGTFIEICKSLVDELNAGWSRDALPPTSFTQQTVSMHFYDSVVVFERGKIPSRASIVTGDRTKRIG